ncbi:MAG TPA: hypothetical protein VFL27_11570 [Candidatus Dormibacteraeota bacterium]|nr:hypothetical protein [Candidatus Dormibacteraeota bacterium]
MRVLAVVVFVAALVACSGQTSVTPSPSNVSAAQTPAADLRTHLDLLLGEHVMIVAKETAAAVYHSDEYAPYTTLLGANTADLAALMGRAFGSTTATQFTQAWNMQNAYLVDYAIGVVTYDDDKANAAMGGLRGKFLPQFAQIVDARALGDQITADKAFIDDLFAQRFAQFYSDLHLAYAHSQAVGDALTRQIVQRFPDKFPGSVDGRDVTNRVNDNLLLQERAYLVTMATDAGAAKRDAEKIAAVAALATSAGKPWTDWDAALVAYASGGAIETSGFVDRLVTATGAPRSAVEHYVAATVKVVDDQKSKSSKTLADDDRAAATATAPLADSLFQG